MIRRCHVCGCTDMHACPGRCWWVGADICSSCGIAASRHLRERSPLRRPRRRYWTKHVDIEMGFVTWHLRAVVRSKCLGIDVTLGIDELAVLGRRYAAHVIRQARSDIRWQLAHMQ